MNLRYHHHTNTIWSMKVTFFNMDEKLMDNIFIECIILTYQQ